MKYLPLAFAGIGFLASCADDMPSIPPPSCEELLIPDHGVAYRTLEPLCAGLPEIKRELSEYQAENPHEFLPFPFYIDNVNAGIRSTVDPQATVSVAYLRNLLFLVPKGEKPPEPGTVTYREPAGSWELDYDLVSNAIYHRFREEKGNSTEISPLHLNVRWFTPRGSCLLEGILENYARERAVPELLGGDSKRGFLAQYMWDTSLEIQRYGSNLVITTDSVRMWISGPALIELVDWTPDQATLEEWNKRVPLGFTERQIDIWTEKLAFQRGINDILLETLLAEFPSDITPQQAEGMVETFYAHQQEVEKNGCWEKVRFPSQKENDD